MGGSRTAPTCSELLVLKGRFFAECRDGLFCEGRVAKKGPADKGNPIFENLESNRSALIYLP